MASVSLAYSRQDTGSAAAPLDVFVLFAGIRPTGAALRTAAQLAHGLSARICLLALECVPYPLPLDQPAAGVAFLEQRFRALLETTRAESAAHPVQTVASLLLCRDPWDTLRTLLPPQSVVVIPARSRWWPQPEDRLARRLRAAGHHVVRTSFQKELSHA